MSSKDACLQIRLDSVLRQGFIDACRKNERTAAQVLRQFMKAYLERDGQDAQIDLFENDPRIDHG